MPVYNIRLETMLNRPNNFQPTKKDNWKPSANDIKGGQNVQVTLQVLCRVFGYIVAPLKESSRRVI